MPYRVASVLSSYAKNKNLYLDETFSNKTVVYKKDNQYKVVSSTNLKLSRNDIVKFPLDYTLYGPLTKHAHDFYDQSIKKDRRTNRQKEIPVEDPLKDDLLLSSNRLCKASDIAIKSNLFGGTMASWLDEAAMIASLSINSGSTLVTKVIKEIAFHAPVKTGDVVLIEVFKAKTGRTSITLDLRATRTFDGTTFSQVSDLVCTTSIVFVAVDDLGHPTALNLN